MRTLSSFETTLRRTPSHAHLAGDRCPPLRVTPWSRRESGPPAWFPEALLAGAVQADVMHRFERAAEEAGLHLVHYQASAFCQVSGTDGGDQLTAIVLRPWATVEGGEAELAAASELLEDAVANSPVARVLAVPIQAQVMVDAVAPAQVARELAEVTP